VLDPGNRIVMANLSALPLSERDVIGGSGAINDAAPLIGTVEGARADEDVLAAFGVL
jgi:hypothetical protein